MAQTSLDPGVDQNAKKSSNPFQIDKSNYLMKLAGIVFVILVLNVGREIILQFPKHVDDSAVSSIQIDVVNWHNVNYDTMPEGVNHGTSFLKVQYPSNISDDQLIHDIRLTGTVIFFDGFIENVDGFCIRAGTENLARAMQLLRSEGEREPDPLCWLRLSHELNYTRKPQADWTTFDGQHSAIDSETRITVMHKVSSPQEVNINALPRVVTKPSLIQVKFLDWISASWDRITKPFERV